MGKFGRLFLGVCALVCLAPIGGCSHDSAAPSLPPLSMTLPAQVSAQYIACATCAEPLTAVATFAVTVDDTLGPGGTLVSLETRVTNTSRGTEVARNTRPNGDVGLSASALPAHGRLSVEAGIGFPAPPPRDSLSVTVTARLTDGREVSASAPLAVSGQAM